MKKIIPISNSAPGVLKVEDAAKLLRCTKSQIRELLRSGQLCGFKVGTQWRLTKKAILQYIVQSEEEMRAYGCRQ